MSATSSFADMGGSRISLAAPPPGKSIHQQYLVCLETGKRFQSLKRHLGKLGMTPDEYRAKWNLPRDYPMVAPALSARRSEAAKAMKFGNLSKKSRGQRKRGSGRRESANGFDNGEG